jgi:hypothetical protein
LKTLRFVLLNDGSRPTPENWPPVEMAERVRGFFREQTGCDWEAIEYTVKNVVFPTSRRNGQGLIASNMHHFINFVVPEERDVWTVMFVNDDGDINESDMSFGFPYDNVFVAGDGYPPPPHLNNGGRAVVGRIVTRNLDIPERAGFVAHEACHTLGLADTWEPDKRMTWGNSYWGMALAFGQNQCWLDEQQKTQVRHVLPLAKPTPQEVPMRNTYVSVPMVAEPWESLGDQRPTKIVMHRQGNPGVEGEAGADWGKRTGAFSIHRYIDDARVRVWIPFGRQAKHVSFGGNAAKFGLPATGRGDANTIGIEMEDESPTSAPLAPGQTYGLSQETRITAVLLVADILRLYRHMTVADIIEHADLDPDNRPEDTGDALNLVDFRLDVQDVLDGKTPWRTVGKFATGSRMPGEAKPPVVVPLPQPKPAIHLIKVGGEGITGGDIESRGDGVFARRYDFGGLASVEAVVKV